MQQDPITELDAIPDSQLPSHWTRRQRTKNNLIYISFNCACAGIRRLPSPIVRLLNQLIGALAPWAAKHDYQRAQKQLKQAFPNKTTKECRTIARKMFRHLAEALTEVLRLKDTFARHPELALSPEHRQLLQDALNENKGVIAITGHIGNWELLAQTIARAGFPLTSVGRLTYDPRLTRWLHNLRTSNGMRLLWRSDRPNTKAVFRTLKQNRILAILIDQDTDVNSTFVPFFGRPAQTPTAAAVLALRTGAPIIVSWLQKHQGRFHLSLERFSFSPTGDSPRDIQDMTADLTNKLEQAISQSPEQWVWMHERWHHQEPPQQIAQTMNIAEQINHLKTAPRSNVQSIASPETGRVQ